MLLEFVDYSSNGQELNKYAAQAAFAASSLAGFLPAFAALCRKPANDKAELSSQESLATL